MSLSTEKHKVLVTMFDGLVGAGRGKTESGGLVYLYTSNITRIPGRFRCLNPGETVTCNLEPREGHEGAFYATDIDMAPRAETAPIKMHLIEEEYEMTSPSRDEI